MLRCRVVVVVVVGILLMTLSCLTQALIVPQEVPSILSLVYSNIPPIRKGTDSRLGFGFRLGEHADFQVVVELGPQKDTRPLMNADSSSSKRQVNQNDYKRIRPRPEESTTAASWLQNWANDVNKKKKITASRHQQKYAAENETIKNDYIKTGTMIPQSALKQLQQLYKMATTGEPDAAGVTDQRKPVDMLSIISPRNVPKIRKTKGEITDELMDVKLE